MGIIYESGSTINTNFNVLQDAIDVSSYNKEVISPSQQTGLSFDINGKTIEFSGQEIVRLKEMLAKYINENHPEDLL